MRQGICRALLVLALLVPLSGTLTSWELRVLRASPA